MNLISVCAPAQHFEVYRSLKADLHSFDHTLSLFISLDAAEYSSGQAPQHGQCFFVISLYNVLISVQLQY